METLVGPRWEALHSGNVILRARAATYRADVAAGPFSVKGVVSGEVTWRTGGQAFRVTPGAHLVLDRDEPYLLEIDEAKPVETFVVFFADAFVSDLAGARLRPLGDLLDQPQSGGWLPIARRLWEGPNRLNAGMRALQGLIETDTEPGELDLALRGLMDGCADLAAETRRELDRIDVAKPATRQEIHRRVTRGRAWLDAHFDGSFDLAAAAAEACLSPHHFHRSFRAICSESPFAYVARRRIERAKTMLALTDDPVAEICAAVGYESLPAFTTCFRRQEGEPPAAWRRKFRGGAHADLRPDLA